MRRIVRPRIVQPAAASAKGLHYLRAAVLALRGQPQDALAQLDKAAALGWRRTWWARHDPALASLRDKEGFANWLRTLDASNRIMAARVNAL